MEITIFVGEQPWISVQPSPDKVSCTVELDVRSSGYLKVVESISSLSLVEDDGSEPVHLDGDEVVSNWIGTTETKHLEAVKPAELTPSASVLQIDRCPHGKPFECSVDVPCVQHDDVTHDTSKPLKRPAIASVQNKQDQQDSKPLQLTATAGIQSYESHVYEPSQTTATASIKSDGSHVDSKPSEAPPTASIKSDRSHVDNKPSEATPTASIKSDRSHDSKPSEATPTASIKSDRSHDSKPSEATPPASIQSHRSSEATVAANDRSHSSKPSATATDKFIQSHGSTPSKPTDTSSIQSDRPHGDKSSTLVDEVELTILVKRQPWISKQPSDTTLAKLRKILVLDARRLKYLKVNETIPYLRLVSKDDDSEPEDLFGEDIVSDLINNMGTKHLEAVVKRKPAGLTPATSVKIDKFPHGSRSPKRPAVPSFQNNQDPHVDSKPPQRTAAASIRSDRSDDSELDEPTAAPPSVQKNDRLGGSKLAEPTAAAGDQSDRCPHCHLTRRSG